MEIMEYQVIMVRIQEIEQEQLSWLDYVDKHVDMYVDSITGEQEENIREKMLQLQEEKNNLLEYIK